MIPKPAPGANHLIATRALTFPATVFAQSTFPVGATVSDYLQGRILETAAPADFFSNPVHERAGDFLSKVLAH